MKLSLASAQPTGWSSSRWATRPLMPDTMGPSYISVVFFTFYCIANNGISITNLRKTPSRARVFRISVWMMGFAKLIVTSDLGISFSSLR